MDAKDEVKERLNVEDVVGEYIELKRAGRNLKGLSPFTKEKSASLIVSPEKQIWHDFSSNQGGDMFSFVMMMEGIDFKNALTILARKAGVEIAQFKGDGKRAKRKERITAALVLATKYYHASLTKNKPALAYVVEKRGYGKQILSSFKIGYAPNSGQALRKFLASRGFNDSELKDAGLVTQRSGGYMDMFRGRIMVPLADGQGNPIGFTARVLDDSLPKYINTPQTLVYDKSRHVFGLHLAKEAIRDKNFVVIVEGNMDVVASHKTSVHNVVASAGTALTKDHLKQVYRISNDVRLAFDQDRAGIAATERAIPIAQELGVRLSIIDVPDGKDPDELIAKDPAKWEEAVTSSKYVMDWLMDRYEQLYDITTAEGKRMYTDTVLGVLASVDDPVEQEHYMQIVAKKLSVSTEVVKKKLVQLAKKPAPKKRAVKPVVQREDESQNSAYQDLLLGLALRYGDVDRSFKDLKSDFFDDSKRKSLCAFILENVNRQPFTECPKELQQIEEYVKMIIFKTEELYDEWSATDRMIEAIGLARRLTNEHQQKRKKELTVQIKEAEAAGDRARQKQLLSEFDDLLKE